MYAVARHPQHPPCTHKSSPVERTLCNILDRRGETRWLKWYRRFKWISADFGASKYDFLEERHGFTGVWIEPEHFLPTARIVNRHTAETTVQRTAVDLNSLTLWINTSWIVTSGKKSNTITCWLLGNLSCTMPLFPNKFSPKKIPSRKSDVSVSRVVDPSDSQEFSSEIGPIKLCLGDQEAVFENGLWIPGLSRLNCNHAINNLPLCYLTLNFSFLRVFNRLFFSMQKQELLVENTRKMKN